MKKKIVGLIILSMLILFSILRYQYVNRNFPSPIIEKYAVKDVVSLDNFEVTVEKMENCTYEEVKQRYDKNLNQTYDNKYYLVSLKIKNTGKEKIKFQYSSISFQCENNATGYSMDLIYKVNQEIIKEYKPGQEANVIIPFQLDKRVYSVDSWEKLDSITKMVVFSVYPVKKVVEI